MNFPAFPPFLIELTDLNGYEFLNGNADGLSAFEINSGKLLPDCWGNQVVELVSTPQPVSDWIRSEPLLCLLFLISLLQATS